MPLSEKLRLQAGRPFIHTLIARIAVCAILIIATLIVCNKLKPEVKNSYHSKNEKILPNSKISQVHYANISHHS